MNYSNSFFVDSEQSIYSDDSLQDLLLKILEDSYNTPLWNDWEHNTVYAAPIVDSPTQTSSTIQSLYNNNNPTTCNLEMSYFMPTVPIASAVLAVKESTSLLQDKKEENLDYKTTANKKKRKDSSFTSEEIDQIQSKMKKPRTKYNRNVSKPYDSMVHQFKYK